MSDPRASDPRGSDPWPHAPLGNLTVEDIARHAEALLNDPVLAAVMNEMDADAVTTWRRSASPAQREDAWQRMTAIADLRTRLNQAIDNFKLRAARNRRSQISTD